MEAERAKRGGVLALVLLLVTASPVWAETKPTQPKVDPKRERPESRAVARNARCRTRPRRR